MNPRETRLNDLVDDIESLLSSFPGSDSKANEATSPAPAEAVRLEPASEPEPERPSASSPTLPDVILPSVPAPSVLTPRIEGNLAPILDVHPSEDSAIAYNPIELRVVNVEPPVGGAPALTPVPTPALEAVAAPASTGESRLRLTVPYEQWARYSPSNGQILRVLLCYPEGEVKNAASAADDLEAMTFKLFKRVMGIKVLAHLPLTNTMAWDEALMGEVRDRGFSAVLVYQPADGSEPAQRALQALKADTVPVMAISTPLEQPKVYYADRLAELVIAAQGAVTMPQLPAALIQKVAGQGLVKASRSMPLLLSASATMSGVRQEWIPFGALFTRLRDPEDSAVGVHVNLRGELEGTALVVLSPEQTFDLCDLALRRAPRSTKSLGEPEQGALKELGNTIAHSYLTSMNFAWGMMASYEPPQFSNSHFKTVLETTLSDWPEGALLAPQVLHFRDQIIAGGFKFEISFLLFLTQTALKGLAGETGGNAPTTGR